jgi:hypothetical protein
MDLKCYPLINDIGTYIVKPEAWVINAQRLADAKDPL